MMGSFGCGDDRDLGDHGGDGLVHLVGGEGLAGVEVDFAGLGVDDVLGRDHGHNARLDVADELGAGRRRVLAELQLLDRGGTP